MRLWLLSLFVCFLSLSLNGADCASRPTVINVGALFNFNSTIGRVANIAIEEAVNEVNSNSTILHGTKLNIIKRNSVCNGFLGFVQAMHLLGNEVVAILGPQSSVVAHIVSPVATQLQVPLLSFAASDPTLTSLGSPFFVRATNSDKYQMAAVAEIVDYYGWKEVIAVYHDDDYGRNGIAALGDALAEKRCKISYRGPIPPLINLTRGNIMDVLVKIAVRESRVIVLHVNPDSGRMIFDVASFLGMMGNGYAWICTDWLSSVLDSYSPLPSEVANMMQGVLVLRQHTPDSNGKRAFLSRWKNLTNGSLGLNAYGLYAYDSVWILAHALEAFLNQGGNISFSTDSRLLSLNGSHLHLEALRIFNGGQALLSNILQSNLLGLTGPLKFDPDRSRIRPAYDIINVIGTGYHLVGYWSNYSGLSIEPPESLYSKPPNRSRASQRLNPVFWPDGTTMTPRGWVFPNSGQQLRIGVPIRASFKEFVSLVAGSNDTFKGFCIDVFVAAVNLLPYAVPYRFVGYGDGRKNPNYTNLVQMVEAGNFDGAVGDISITTSRTRIVDFTQPYTSSGLEVVVAVQELNSGGWSFLQPFTPSMWSVIVISFIAIGVVVWILEHRINDDFRGSPRKQCITILWFSFSTLTYSHKEEPVSCPARLVLVLWLFVVMILTSSYTASLTSILTVHQLSSPIKGIDSLRASGERIGYQVGSFAEQYLVRELNISKSRLVELDTPEDFDNALRHGRVGAVVDESPYLNLFLSTHCDFRIVGQEFTRSGWGFAFPRDSPLAPDLSTAILKLSENGELQRIHDKWLTTSTCSQNASQVESSLLQLRSFVGLFLISGIACALALVIYFSRICYRFYHASKTEVVSDIQGGSRMKNLKTLKSLIDEKKEPSQKKRKKRQETEDLPFDYGTGEETGRTPNRSQTQIVRNGDPELGAL